MDEGESEQNEMRNLQEKLESTTRLVFTLSQQLNELKEQVKNRLNDYLSGSWERGEGTNTVVCANRKTVLCIPKIQYVPIITNTFYSMCSYFGRASKECALRFRSLGLHPEDRTTKQCRDQLVKVFSKIKFLSMEQSFSSIRKRFDTKS